jgi:TatD DNase family protein
LKLIDTHCHIHSDFFELEPEVVLQEAMEGGVYKLVCVATTVDDAKKAVSFAQAHTNVYAAIAIHPHHAAEEIQRLGEIDALLQENDGAIVAIGDNPS